MRKFASLVAMIGLLSVVSFAGVAKESFKASKFAGKESFKAAKFSGKRAAHYSVKAGKVAKKVLY